MGESEVSNTACATPIPGETPTDLFAYAEAGAINLEWGAGSAGVIEYHIYRDGVEIGTSILTSYIDNEAEHEGLPDGNLVEPKIVGAGLPAASTAW